MPFIFEPFVKGSILLSLYQRSGEIRSSEAGAGGFDITIKEQTMLIGGIIASTVLAEKNNLTAGSIITAVITNNASAQVSSDDIIIIDETGLKAAIGQKAVIIHNSS